MSTQAYLIMDAVRDMISANYTSKLELANNGDIENNADHILKDGFDVSIGAATNEGEMGGRGNAMSREMSIVLTKSFYDNDLGNDNRHSAEETMLQEIINIGSLLKNTQSVVQKVLDIELTGDSGIDVINAEKIKFLTTTIEFNVRYVEFY